MTITEKKEGCEYICLGSAMPNYSILCLKLKKKKFQTFEGKSIYNHSKSWLENFKLKLYAILIFKKKKKKKFRFKIWTQKFNYFGRNIASYELDWMN